MRLTFLSLFVLLSLASSAWSAPLKVGLVIDHGGRQDKGFNSAAIDGLEKAKRAFHVAGDIAEAPNDAGHEALLRDFARKHYDLVIALGAARTGALKKVAAEFPNVNFALIDGEVKAPNVRSILFKEEEGSYLVGAIGALMSKSGKLGFVGGMKIPVIQRYEAGYRAGALAAKPATRVDVRYIGDTSAAWNDKPKAKSLSRALYDGGDDVIYAVSGGSNLGVFDSADETGKYAIGVSNQNWVKPGRILTSMRKRVDIAVFITCQDAMTGGFSAETKHYGLAEQGVDFVVDRNNRKLLPDSVIARANALRDRIVDGKITVPSR